MKAGLAETPDVVTWLNEVVGSKGVVGIDPLLCTIAYADDLIARLGAAGRSFKPVRSNLVGNPNWHRLIWCR